MRLWATQNDVGGGCPGRKQGWKGANGRKRLRNIAQEERISI